MAPRLDGSARVPLGVRRGDDFTGRLIVNDLDWTGDTFAAQLRVSTNASGDPLATFTVGTPTLSGGNTVVEFTLSDTVTAATPGNDPNEDAVFYYDLTRTSGGITSTIIFGEFTVYGGVTHA